jgi:hypothetical protein
MAGQIVAPNASAPKHSSGSFILDWPSFRYRYANSAENVTGFRSKEATFRRAWFTDTAGWRKMKAAVEAEAVSAEAQPAWE